MRFRATLYIILCTLAIAGCSDIPKDPISFKIINTSDFTAYYIVNDGGIVTVNPPDIVIDNGIYYYEKKIDDLDMIEISATSATAATTLRILVYRNGDKVKEESKTTSTSDLTLTVDYAYGEEDVSSTSGT